MTSPPPRSDCSQNGAATSFAWLLGALPITNFDRLVVTLFTRDISLRAQQTNHQLGALNKRMHSGPFQIVRLLICSFSFSLPPPNDDVVVTDMRLLEATFLAGRRLLLPVRLQYRRGNIYFIIQRVLRTLLWLTWFRSSIHVAWRRWSRPAPSSTPTWYSCASRHTDSLVTIGKWRQSRKK